MASETILLLNQIIQNFQVKLKDAGHKRCDESWNCARQFFPYDSIGYIKKGSIYMGVNRKGQEIKTGEMYYIPAMTEYSHRVLEECVEVYWTHFELGETGKEMSSRIEFPVGVCPKEPQAVEALFEELFRSRVSNVLGAPLRYTGLMCELAACFFELSGDHASLRSTGKSEKMRHIAEYIRANLDKNLTVEFLAAQIGLSPNYFIRAFQQFFQEPPIHFVLNQREQAARELLEKSEMSIKQIGFSLGFSNQNYFSEFFKKRSGYSPSEYRELKGVLHSREETKEAEISGKQSQ